MSKNKDCVPIRPDYDQAWVLVVPSDSTKPQAQVSELIDVCTSLYDAFEGFILPCEITYAENLYPEGWSLDDIWENIDQRIDLERPRLASDDGVPLERVTAAFERAKADGKYIQSVDFERSRVKVRLDSGDRFVDRNDRVIEYRGSDPVEASPTTDPLSIRLGHALNRSDSEIDSEFVFDVRVKTKSQIWFGDDETSRVNGRRLRDFLEEVQSSLSVQKVVRDTDYNNTEHMEAVF